MLEFAAVIANLATVAGFAWASFTHFDLDEPAPLGSQFITVATPAATIANFLVWKWGPGSSSFAAGSALALALAAATLFLLAKMSAPKRTLSRAFSERTPGALVDTGVYAYIRNPLYTAYMLYWASWAVLTHGHWLSLIILAVMVTTYVRAALLEERQLNERLGDAYRYYASRTKRFLPWIV